nr:hypothetical protein [Myxococcales bacterium]
ERVGKGGRQVFINASYTPIRDGNGNVYKIVKFATDVTQQTQQILAFQKAGRTYSAEMMRLVEELQEGNLSVRGDVESQGESYRDSMVAMNHVIETIAAPIEECVDTLRGLAVGQAVQAPTGQHRGIFGELTTAVVTLKNVTDQITDISRSIADGKLDLTITMRSDEDALMSALGKMVEDLNELLHEVQRTSKELDHGSDQVREASQSLADNSARSAASMQEMTATMKQILDQTEENAENAGTALTKATDARTLANQGDEQMQTMVASMRDIEEASRNISRIIKVIDDIAFQTNLLALNAAVEAGRAGVHGRGFAVVAEEVRRLAARSANAAKETTEMIEGSARKVTQGLSVAERTATSLSGIVQSISQVGDLLGDIAAASQEQATGIGEVNVALDQIDSTTQMNTAKAEEMAAAANGVSSNSGHLAAQLERFELARSTTARHPEHDEFEMHQMHRSPRSYTS